MRKKLKESEVWERQHKYREIRGLVFRKKRASLTGLLKTDLSCYWIAKYLTKWRCYCFQGILFATPECLKQPNDLIRLWLHESSRVYGDKLVETKDCSSFHKRLLDTAHKYFEVWISPGNIFCNVNKLEAFQWYVKLRRKDKKIHNIAQEVARSKYADLVHPL